MKRSNRLILLIGVFLAVVAFVGIVVIFGKSEPGTTTTTPTTAKVVTAIADMKLGDAVTADKVNLKEIPIADKPVDAFGDVGLVIGKTVRVDVKKGAILTTSGTFPQGGAVTALNVAPSLDKGLRAIAIQVDQVTGVGTIIQAGDRVDVVLGIKIQEMQNDPKNPGTITPVPGGPQLSVKTVIQNVKVVGTLLPPPAAAQNGQQPQASQAAGTTTLNGQQEIVLVAVTANQAEVIRYAQLGAEPITLTLRSPVDASAPPDQSDGIVLAQLISKYGVLPPLPFIATGPLR